MSAPSSPPYDKLQAVRDLITIIHARSTDASADNPLCEVRMGRNGTYHRFPPKLQAMARLVKLMGWDEPEPVEQKDNFIALLARIRSRRQLPSPDPSSSSSENPESSSSTDAASPESSPPSTTEIPPPPPAVPSPRCHSPSSRAHAHRQRLESATGYRRDDAVHDLVTIIHAPPALASPAHPLCEERLTSWGTYHRFPSKLGAIHLLARMTGWHDLTRSDKPHDPDFRFKALAAFVRNRK